MSISTLLILILIGISAGMVSGMVGVGGGIIIVPALVYGLGLSQFAAQGTSLAAMLPPIGILAAYNYYRADALDWKYALVISIAFVLGGYFGSKLTIGFISEATLKKIFGGLMLAGAIKLIFFSK
ncbi:MAG: sulfite exporter TauE/SafE family protein [Flavobacteriales bacterium]|nr:sulfite exporter TauE/SafE family protein [Flavobacteriales bacterium]